MNGGISQGRGILAEHPLPRAWRLRIVAATRDLITECGGAERSAELLGVHPGSVYRYQQDKDLIPLLSAMVLEADCGRPYVTKVMADYSGHQLTRAEDDDPDKGVNIDARHNAVLREFADVAHAVAEARADGRYSVTDAERIERAAADLARAVDDLREDCAEVKAAAASNVSRLPKQGGGR
jgi:AcrR family transcriptional regulator